MGMTKYQMSEAQAFLAKIVFRKLDEWEAAHPAPAYPTDMEEHPNTDKYIVEMQVTQQYWGKHKADLSDRIMNVLNAPLEGASEYRKLERMIDDVRSLVFSCPGIKEELAKEQERIVTLTQEVDDRNACKKKDWEAKKDAWKKKYAAVEEKLRAEKDKIVQKMLFGGSDVTADVEAFGKIAV